MTAASDLNKVDELIESVKPKEVRFIDPMKMAEWPLELACEMVGGAISEKSIMRAIDAGELKAHKPGKKISVTPVDFLTWYRRFAK